MATDHPPTETRLVPVSIGTPVQVEFSEAEVGTQTLYVAGVDMGGPGMVAPEYWLSETWPVKCRGDVSTGWKREAFALIRPAPVAGEGKFQPRVHQWLLDCFGWEIAGDRQERGDRLLEEVLELLQSGGYDPARVAALRDYVWGRPVGEPAQEVGGVMVTLAAYCVAHDLDMMGAGETELARIVQPEIVEKIRSKQAAKPTGSALSIEGTTPAQSEALDEGAAEDPVAWRWRVEARTPWVVCDQPPPKSANLQVQPLFVSQNDGASQ